MINWERATSLTNWRTKWENYIGIDARRHEPGFLGPIPYILILRYFIAVAVILRFSLHRSQYTEGQWWVRVLVFALIVLIAAAATYLTRFPKHILNQSQQLQAFFIILDILLVSFAYLLTNNPESDFFLFYYLPIFATVEYVDNTWGVAAICSLVVVAMVIVVFAMHPLPKPPWSPAALAWRVIIPRALFLLLIVWSSALAFKGLARRRAELRSLLDAIHFGGAALPDVQALDEALESILTELIETLKFEFAAISLVDEYRDCIETVRGRNISPGWIRRAKHSLNDTDIQTYIVRTHETKVVAGWDELLDKEIYDRFEHWRLARVWAPIVSKDQRVVGTIEAGCAIERKETVLTDAVRDRVTQLGQTKGDAIARTRPHVLLETIADRAIRLIGADSASLHVYRQKDSGEEWGELILAAGAGKATPDFVKSDQPRQRGRGRNAIRTGKPEWVDDPQQFKMEYPELYAANMRALAVIPLTLPPDAEGILGIHFWQSGKRFTPRDLDLAGTFAREMEIVIQNYLLLRRATEASSRAWALSGLQSLMQSQVSPFNLSEVLQRIARNALLTFDADSVEVYQYRSDSSSFIMPPVTDGQSTGTLKADADLGEILSSFVEQGMSEFIVNAHEHPVLGVNCKSCAVLVLRSTEGGEVVGLILLRFIKIHEFSAEEKRAMAALASAAALSIRTARLHRAELEAMRAVHAAIAEKGPDLRQVLERLLQQTLALTGATYGICMRPKEHTEILEAVARWPPSDRTIDPQQMGEGIVGLAAESKMSILAEDVKNYEKFVYVEGFGRICPAKEYKEVNSGTRCELAVPVLEDDQSLLGILNIEHTEPGGLNEEHKALLERLAVPVVIAIHTVELYKQLQRRIRHLSSLMLIAARVQENPYELDTMLRLFLTGVTAGEGLGFSRAMLFLADPKAATLRGKLAIGSVSGDEADATWRAFEGRGSSATTLNALLRDAERRSHDIREGKVVDYTLLSIKLQTVSIELHNLSGVLNKCLDTGSPVSVQYLEPDPFREVLRLLAEPPEFPQAFACAPLIGKQMKPIGVLVVDNRFLPKERAIDPEDLVGLEAFARLLALSIENLQTTTLDRIMHELRSPAAALKSDLSYLERRFNDLPNDKVQEKISDLLLDIELVLLQVSEVERFLGIGPQPLVRKRTVIFQDVIVKVINQLRRLIAYNGLDPQRLTYNFDMSQDVALYLDPARLVSVVLNLLLNAIKYAEDDPTQFSIRIELEITRDHYILKFKDWGIGVKEEFVTRVFDLGFRAPEAKAKSVSGYGFGLSNARAVMRELGGDLTMVNNYRPTEFDVMLPKDLAEAPDDTFRR